jgi:hypothetical protein
LGLFVDVSGSIGEFVVGVLDGQHPLIALVEVVPACLEELFDVAFGLGLVADQAAEPSGGGGDFHMVGGVGACRDLQDFAGRLQM